MNATKTHRSRRSICRPRLQKVSGGRGCLEHLRSRHGRTGVYRRFGVAQPRSVHHWPCRDRGSFCTKKWGTRGWTTPFARNSGAFREKPHRPCGSSTSATTAAVNAGAVTATNCGSSPTRGSCARREASINDVPIDEGKPADSRPSRLPARRGLLATGSGEPEIANIRGDFDEMTFSTYRAYQVTGQRHFELVGPRVGRAPVPVMSGFGFTAAECATATHSALRASVPEPSQPVGAGP